MIHTGKIKELAARHYDEAMRIRHQLHMYPEIAFQEEKTAALIAETLGRLGIEFRAGIAKTGVLGIIRGKKPGKTVLLRADMDALSMPEEADVAYKSRIPGVMHACAHDGHTAGLLLCAMILNDMKDDLAGNVKLMFQPAEEREGGALPMIQEGILDDPKVDAAFACHLWGNAKEGTVLVRNGPTMASTDEFTIRVIGKGGHGARPQNTVDPVVIAAEVVNAMQVIISRNKAPVRPAVISICTINGGTAHNVIPEVVELTGTIRTSDHETRDFIPKTMESFVAGITRMHGARYEFHLLTKFPPLINDEKSTDLAKKSIAKIVGDENVSYLREQNMGGEDFAYLCQHVPASFFFVGIAPGDEPVQHHNPEFQWDDKNLLISAGCLCQIAFDFLES